MAIHERDPFSTSADQPAWPHPHDDHAFTVGCPGCDTTRAILSIEIELRLAVRDLWIAGWAPADLVDEVRRRTGSIDARDLVVHALLDENARRSEQAMTEEWTRALTFLAATSGVEPVTTGWVARWFIGRADCDAAEAVLFDVLDALEDLVRDVP
jgi:hypothetical protein